MAKTWDEYSEKQKRMWRFASRLRVVTRYEELHGRPNMNDERLNGYIMTHSYRDEAEKHYFQAKRFVLSYEAEHPGAIAKQIEFDRIRAEHHNLAGVEVH